MASSVQSSEERRTEFRLLKPMPSRQDGDASDAPAARGEAWDTQIRRLFPARDTPPGELPAVNGIQLGHFEIEERIARGGMGTVFRARDLRLDRDVALKVLSQDQLRDPAAVQRFQNEARAAAKLDHENIARVYYVGEDRGVHFIAFEYVHGTTVRELIAAKGHLSQDESVNYTLQAAEALRHTDMAGVVHRDIKPSNLIVTPSGRVKLVDLGLARQIAPTDDDDLTVTGTTLGTFDYISPEQARDPRSVDVRSDIYSLGCSLYQMLTGSPPYPKGSSVDKLLQHSSGRSPDPCELNPRVSPRLSFVVQRMMASNPDERHPSPQALVDELADIAAGLGLRATAPEGTIWRKPLYGTEATWWDENRGWVLAFAIIILLAIVGNDIHRLIDGRQSESSPTAVTTAPVVPQPRRQTTAAADADVRELPSSIPPPSRTAEPSGAPSPAEVIDAGPTAPPIEASQVARNTGEFLLRARPAGPAVTDSPVRPQNPADGSDGPSTEESGNPGIPATAIAVTGTDSPRMRRPTSEDVPAIAASTIPFVVIGSDGTEAGRFETLEAACHVAESGAIIEVHRDGRLSSAQKPILIQGKRLTIRPASGLRPSIRFAPSDEALVRPDLAMIQVEDGSVELYDLNLSMTVANDVFAERWVMISAVRAPEVVLTRVSLTAINAGWRPAVMIERRMPLESSGTMMPSITPIPEARIQIDDCLFRGNAALFVDRTLEPAAVRISDTAISVNDDVLRIEGADRTDMDSVTRSRTQVRFELNHVTALTDRSMVRVWTEDVREIPDIRIECRNSILEAMDSAGPLVLLEGHQDSDTLLQRLTWTGGRNVIVTDSQQACLARGFWPQTGGDDWTYSLGQWQSQWVPDWDLASEAIVDRSVVRWQAGEQARRSTMQIADFALRAEVTGDLSNPALGTASDSSDRGFRPSSTSLPEVVPGPSAIPTASEGSALDDRGT